jgi:hypothetical protein
MLNATLLLQTKLIMKLLFLFLAWLYLNHLFKHYFSSKLWPVLWLFWFSNFILTDLTSFFAQTDHTIERANVNKQFSGGKKIHVCLIGLFQFFSLFEMCLIWSQLIGVFVVSKQYLSIVSWYSSTFLYFVM